MKCIRCNTEWDTYKKIIYPDKCPFCGTVIHGIQQDAAGILHDIVKKYGGSIISDKELLSEAITEYLSYVDINAYDQLSILYALNIIEHYLTKSKLDKALQYISKNISKSKEKDDVDKMMIFALIKASLKTLEQKDLVSTKEFLKRAVKLC